MAIGNPWIESPEQIRFTETVVSGNRHESRLIIRAGLAIALVISVYQHAIADQDAPQIKVEVAPIPQSNPLAEPPPRDLRKSDAKASATGQVAWPQWGGSSLRNHVAAGNLPLDWDPMTGMNLAWKADLGTQTYSSPVVADGKVYIGTNNGSGLDPRFPAKVDMACLVCIDQSTGKLLWQYASPKLPAGRTNDWPQIGLCATSCVAGDRLWVVTNRCEVICLDTNGFHDSENDGAAMDESAQTEIDADVVWKFDMYGSLGVRPLHQSVSSITIVDGVLLLNTSNGPDETYLNVPAPDAPNFLALDAKTGQVVWQDNSAGRSIVMGGSNCSSSGASPAAATIDGVAMAIFAGREGWVYGFDFADLKQGRTTLLWKFDCNPKTSVFGRKGPQRRNTILSTPVVADDRVYIATGQHPERGEGVADLWCIDPQRRGDISPELVFNKSFKNGEQPIPHKFDCACDPQVGDFVRANPNSGAVWHYDRFDRNGNQKFEFEETFHRTIGTPAIHDGLLHIADFGGLVHCVDAGTGVVYWTHDTFAPIWGSCVIADGYVLIGDEDGDLVIFKAGRNRQVVKEANFEQPIFGTPAVVEGTLYVPTHKQLFAIKVKDD